MDGRGKKGEKEETHYCSTVEVSGKEKPLERYEVKTAWCTVGSAGRKGRARYAVAWEDLEEARQAKKEETLICGGLREVSVVSRVTTAAYGRLS